jgi:glycine/D-amino acid oxidase-like deaminating enzyme
MDLKSGYPWWAIRNGLPRDFPPLRDDLRCDVAVLGGGITGALIADEFSAHGHDVAVLEQREVGWGSTAASTALLQYEIDTSLCELSQRYGEADALLAYRACRDAIEMLAQRAGDLHGIGFARADSLYYASSRRDVRTLREEHALRAQHGFDVEWLDDAAIRKRYGFDAPAAILNRPAAQVDPYAMAYSLLRDVERRGASVHARTVVSRIEAGSRGVELEILGGPKVRAKHLVVAAGYETQGLLGVDVARNRSSYAFVSVPLDRHAFRGLHDTLVWETARPYLYLRITPDHRLIAGGLDDTVDIPARRDARVPKKTSTLLARVEKMFPEVVLEPAFAWAGTFAETEDGLPFFGPHPRHGPRVHFAMAYGGNGITYSMIGAGLLRAGVERRRHPLAALFSFDRLER